MTDVDLSEHVSSSADPDGRPRCDIDGFVFPCPALRMALPSQTGEEAELVALVDIGWTIWQAIPVADGWNDLDRQGGLVVGWWDDGLGHRRYRILDFWRGRPRTRSLAAAELDARDLVSPNSRTIRSHARGLARAVSQEKGVVSAREVEMLSDALTLLRTIG
jgi:hypothetical protein